ncbi:S-layer family protein, partial [Coleofasciculus sp. LEGE 07081]
MAKPISSCRQFFQKTAPYSLGFAGSFLCLLSTPNPAQAEVVADTYLPTETIVTPSGTTFEIRGGTQRGSNLFHSFQEFSIPAGSEAFFKNAPEIQNLFGRVTGGQLSTIDGTLRANGTANLFLINPNGIIFGSNARLNIGGSFIASTASSFKFPDGSEFSTTNPQAPSLLAINVPIGLQYGANPRRILNQSRFTDTNGKIIGLQVPPGQTIGLIGGQVSLEGGYLTSEGGRVELGSVGENSFVRLTTTTDGFSAGYEGVQRFQDIQLSQQAAIAASGSGGGNIQVQGAQVLLSGGSQLLADTLGSLDGGGIVIQAQQLSLREGAFVSASTFSSGAAGSLTVKASAVEIIGNQELQAILDQLFNTKTITPSELGSGLFSLSFGSGSANTLTIDTERLSLREGAFISTSPFNIGMGGDMVVRASESVEIVGSELFGDSYGDGDAGQVLVQTRRLTATEGGGIFTSTFGGGRGGNLTVQASDSIELIGTTSDGQFKSGFASNAFRDATQAAGNLRIETRQLTIRDGAGIGAATFGAASGGTLNIQASELVELIGTSQDGKELSSLNTQSIGTGAGGDIQIDTRRLVVRDGGVISTTTQDVGRAGRLVVRASDSVELSGTSADGMFFSSLRSEASSDSVPSSFIPPSQSEVLGEAGDLTVETGQLMVRDGAQISVNGEKLAAAGNLRVNADTIRLENDGKITAATVSGARGNITLRTQNLLLRGGSQISTNADNADGGNIRLDTDTLVALENSDISANALVGAGGRVIINAAGIFGTQFRETQTPESDITATSALGPDFSGIVELNTPEVNPSQGLVELPQTPIDPTRLIATG